MLDIYGTSTGPLTPITPFEAATEWRVAAFCVALSIHFYGICHKCLRF